MCSIVRSAPTLIPTAQCSQPSIKQKNTLLPKQKLKPPFLVNVLIIFNRGAPSPDLVEQTLLLN